jgi:hypothetical protein
MQFPCEKEATPIQIYVQILEAIPSIPPPFQESLAAGEKGHVRFQYMRHPEFLRVGSRILLREGRTKGIGEVTKLIPYHHEPNSEEKKYSPSKRKPTRELE